MVSLIILQDAQMTLTSYRASPAEFDGQNLESRTTLLVNAVRGLVPTYGTNTKPSLMEHQKLKPHTTPHLARLRGFATFRLPQQSIRRRRQNRLGVWSRHDGQGPGVVSLADWGKGSHTGGYLLVQLTTPDGSRKSALSLPGAA